MDFYFLSTAKLFIAISKTGAWVPSEGFLYLILIFGALMTASVAMSAFTFYEDHYWSDNDFREELRIGNKRRKTSPQKSR